jgi:hypothetical protein
MSLAHAWLGPVSVISFTRLRNTGRLCREFVVPGVNDGSRSSSNPLPAIPQKNCPAPVLCRLPPVGERVGAAVSAPQPRLKAPFACYQLFHMAGVNCTLPPCFAPLVIILARHFQFPAERPYRWVVIHHASLRFRASASLTALFFLIPPLSSPAARTL